MKGNNVFPFLIVFCFSIVSCASAPYSSLESTRGHHGYSEQILKDGRILLRYDGTTRHNHDEIEVFWVKRANELCPNGFKALSRKQGRSNNTISVPISGINTRVAAPEPNVYGVIKCLI